MNLFGLLQNDPFGDEGRYGSFIAWILHILRILWVMALGLAMVGGGLAILVVGGMMIKVVFMFFGLFTTDIPFNARL